MNEQGPTDYYFQDPNTGADLVLTMLRTRRGSRPTVLFTGEDNEHNVSEQASRADWDTFVRGFESIHDAARALSRYAPDILD